MTAEEQGPVAETAKVLVDAHTPDRVHIQVHETQGAPSERFRVYIDGKRVSYSGAARDDNGTKITTTEGHVIFINKSVGTVSWAFGAGRQ